MKNHHTKLRARIFQPENRASFRSIVIPPAGSYFNDAGIDAAAAAVIADIKTKRPEHEYRAVRTGPASFNFVWMSKLATALALALVLAGCTRHAARIEIPASCAQVTITDFTRPCQDAGQYLLCDRVRVKANCSRAVFPTVSTLGDLEPATR